MDRIEWGYCDPHAKRIYLNPALRRKDNERMLWETVAHEILHAMDLTTTGATGKWGLKHRHVFRLEGPFGSFLKDNLLRPGVSYAPSSRIPTRPRRSSRRRMPRGRRAA